MLFGSLRRFGSRSLVAGHLKENDPAYDECYPRYDHPVHRIAPEDDADDGGGGDAHPRPDAVGDAKLESLEREGEEDEAGDVDDKKERALLYFELDGEIRPGDDLDAMWERAVPAVRILDGLGPEGVLAQYGLAGRLKGGEPVYEAAYYELPGIGPEAASEVSGNTRLPDPFSIATLHAWKYLECAYIGPWEEIGAAYRQMVDYAADHGIELDSLFYETSAFRLFDNDESPYACTISAATLSDRKPSQR